MIGTDAGKLFTSVLSLTRPPSKDDGLPSALCRSCNSKVSSLFKLESRKSQLRGQFLETRSKIRTKRLRKTPAESLRHASASSEAKDKPAKVFRQGLEPEDSFLAPRAIDFTDDLKYPETVSVLFCQIASYIIIKAFIAAVLLRQSANHKRN